LKNNEVNTAWKWKMMTPWRCPASELTGAPSLSPSHHASSIFNLCLRPWDVARLLDLRGVSRGPISRRNQVAPTPTNQPTIQPI